MEEIDFDEEPAGFRAGQEDVDDDDDEEGIEEIIMGAGGGAMVVSRDAERLANTGPGALVRAIGQKAFDKQLASFMPFGVKPTEVNLSANPSSSRRPPTVHAALESLRWIRRTPNVFVIPAMTDHCERTVRAIMNQPVDAEAAKKAGLQEKDLFHIDQWFMDKRGRGDLGYDPTDPETSLNLLKRDEVKLAKDWFKILIEEETKHPGFVRLLSNALEMEDRILNHMNQRRQLVMSYGNAFMLSRPTPHGLQ